MPYIYFKHSFSNTVFKILQLHLSYRFGLDSNCVSEAMFPNTAITVLFKLSPAKCPYYFFFELPPYLLLCLWIGSLNVGKSPSYTVLFNESPNCYLQEKQMFILDIETNSQKKFSKGLKELRNCISRITCLRSLFCSIRVIRVCIFYWFFWKTGLFCLSALFCVFCLLRVEYEISSNICIIIV